MQSCRIWFPGNPWPEGHGVKEFSWEAEDRDGELWFLFHLVSSDYYAERDIDDPEPTEHDSDWEAPIVWGNFHAATISSTANHRGGFPVGEIQRFSINNLAGRVFSVDRLPLDWDFNPYDLAFYAYILRSDTVADHMHFRNPLFLQPTVVQRVSPGGGLPASSACSILARSSPEASRP
jgi:hypothetical protein